MSIVLNFHCSLPVMVSILIYARADDTISVQIVDRSRSEICSSGLLHLRDAVDFEIMVTFAHHDAIPSNKAFVLELEDLRDMYKTRICYIRYALECFKGINVDEGCFCHNSTRDVYFIRYFAAAHVNYSENVVWVNRKVHEGIKMPKIATADNVTLSVQVNGLNVSLVNQTCNLTFADQRTFAVNFCAHGLSEPSLTISYGDSLTVNGSENCIAAEFKTANETAALEFSHKGRCTEISTMECLIETSTNPVIIPETISHLKLSIIISMSILLGISVLSSIYYAYTRDLFSFDLDKSDDSDSSSNSETSEKNIQADYVSAVVL